jgi:hypothetical protein
LLAKVVNDYACILTKRINFMSIASKLAPTKSVVNDNAGSQMHLGALRFFASKLAPTRVAYSRSIAGA